MEESENGKAFRATAVSISGAISSTLSSAGNFGSSVSAVKITAGLGAGDWMISEAGIVSLSSKTTGEISATGDSFVAGASFSSASPSLLDPPEDSFGLETESNISLQAFPSPAGMA